MFQSHVGLIYSFKIEYFAVYGDINAEVFKMFYLRGEAVVACDPILPVEQKQLFSYFSVKRTCLPSE